MKCPYRVSTNKQIIKSSSGAVIGEETVYEDCYTEDCPFYCTTETYREPFCIRVETEKGDYI